MDLIENDKDAVTGAWTYTQWATANDLGFLIRQHIRPSRHRSCLPAWDESLRRWRHPKDPNCSAIGAIAAKAGMHKEYLSWVSAGRPDGFETANITEYWSQLDPHIRTRDDLSVELVEETTPLREKGVDIFGPAYREKLEVFAGKYLTPVGIKPARGK